MDSDFTITLEGFSNEETGNNVGMVVLEAVKILTQQHQINISNLKKILISFYYGDALQRTATLYNHINPATFTQSKQARGMGQLVSKINPSGFNEEFTLVLSVDFFSELFDDAGSFTMSPEGIKPVLHRLHHELMHVHEKNTLTCLDQSLLFNAYGMTLLIPATRMWSEYLANHKSSQSVTDPILTSFMDILKDVINDIPEEIALIVIRFKSGQISLNEMFEEARKRVNLLINTYGYSIGYAHGLELELSDSFPELFETMSKSKLSLTLDSLGNELSFLMIKYEANTLSGFDDFSPLSIAIEAIYNALGIKLECQSYDEQYIMSVYV